ncbi:MAG: DUF4062 domain-containing protein [Bacteroidetes bacterium]|nr:DUF4062 domain-containing protein [Bacteroidota bacterium]
MNFIQVFISSVQGEFKVERELLRDYIHSDAIMRRFFKVFLFEDVHASDRRPDQLYLNEVENADIYLGLFGNQYGTEDKEGISPTEREFDHATVLRKHRIIFLKGNDDHRRHPKMQALVTKVQSDLVRKRYTIPEELKSAVYAALVGYLVDKELIRTTPFDAAHCVGATLDDLDLDRMTMFIRTARRVRQFPLTEDVPKQTLLKHLNLLPNGQPTNAAILLFGKTPQKFLLSSEIKCVHFHGTRVAKPIPFYKVFRGTVFELVDQAVDFVLSKINLSVGTRSESAVAERTYEIPIEVILEAIVNAVVHRDYTDSSSVQVMVFSDRIEIWNSGSLPSELSLDQLREPHASLPHNPLLANAMFLGKYIERVGSGTLDMIKHCTDAGLPEPKFSIDGGFKTTIIRSSTRTYTIPVHDGKVPLANVDILVLFPNGTWKFSKTDEHGEASIELHSVYLPMTVYAASEGFSAYLQKGWRPEERKLSIQLYPLHHGGSVIFPEGTGYISGLQGRIDPILDSDGRTYLYASNIAINNGELQPVAFGYNEELHLTDSGGSTVQIRISHMVNRSVLVEYRHPESQPESQPESGVESQPESGVESLETRILHLLKDGPLSKNELSAKLGQKRISGQLNKVVRSLIAEEIINLTIPEKPQSRLQKYRLAE